MRVLSNLIAHEAPLTREGELAQLARALALHARGHRFDSGILHKVLNNLKFIDILVK